ncbi:LysE family translocator [Ascidiimonas sp. W6]|uniref:LysE family translocator n=1 Tax=Ascidiimonas meishanensis TaxID=3128903 RepID=UPI0030EF0B1A
MTQDILAAIPWGILLAFTIGPVFFVLLETAAIKGFRAALMFDFGVIVGDIFFILVAYFSTNKILERLKDDPRLFVFGGVILVSYGIISFIKNKKDYRKSQNSDTVIDLYRANYLALFFKGFLLNFINIGVLGFWLGIIIVFGPKLEMQPSRIFTFFTTIVVVYFLVDCMKILLAKQLRNRLTSFRIYKVKRVISIILMIFGVALIVQGFFPDEKDKIRNAIEDIRHKKNP